MTKIKSFGSFAYSFAALGYGVALLWYKPERRLSVSLWSRTMSRNVRLFGPRKLSFEN